MKEATGELNMTIIVIIAAGVIITLLIPFLKGVFDNIKEDWDTNRAKQNQTFPYKYERLNDYFCIDDLGL
ncbi:MAG: hypothetical protein PHS45_01930 [Bacilli bacterium]|nr:hypothetical protein [Bacilli bacterium]